MQCALVALTCRKWVRLLAAFAAATTAAGGAASRWRWMEGGGAPTSAPARQIQPAAAYASARCDKIVTAAHVATLQHKGVVVIDDCLSAEELRSVAAGSSARACLRACALVSMSPSLTLSVSGQRSGRFVRWPRRKAVSRTMHS